MSYNVFNSNCFACYARNSKRREILARQSQIGLVRLLHLTMCHYVGCLNSIYRINRTDSVKTISPAFTSYRIKQLVCIVAYLNGQSSALSISTVTAMDLFFWIGARCGNGTAFLIWLAGRQARSSNQPIPY